MNWFRNIALLLSLAFVCVCCSTEEADEGVEAQRDITSCFNAEGKAWLTLDISPDAIGGFTRAANGSFDDGEDTESTIKTLTLVLLHGTGTEDQMRVASTYNVLYSPATDEHQQITHHTEKTIQISADNITAGDHLYILAIANLSTTINAGSTYASLKQTVINNIATEIDGTDYFVMSSSPLATANDGSGKTETLTWIDPNNLYGSAEEASTHPAGVQIYLERAAVKVTVDTHASLDLRVAGNTDIDFTRADIQYSLYNYNTNYYLVRHFDESWLPYNASSTGYRFVESVALSTGKYRTYWATDANYDNSSTPDAVFKQWQAMGASDYCAENTFAVSHMQDDRTTSVLVRLQLNGGNNFYTTNVTGSDIVYQEPATTVSEEGTSANQSFARRRSSEVSTAKPIDEYLREWLWQTNSDLRNWVRTYAAGETKHIKIAVLGNSSTGLATVSITQTAQASGAGVTAFEALALDTYLANNIVVNYYHQGYCYYRVPIKHFGDELTPWSSAPAMTDETPAAAYAGNDADYLGRYGVVRNNWYTVSIRRVTHVGSPVIPELTQNADDQVEQLLNATLTIKNWTNHNQDL
ncbi:MAG: Mfa1 fimbrilin C-terminal domain-containing protein [Prevotella sp.]|nr:Mfa1 fimbrilin C-terminal domain-containing protein [Prevotella sp.]MBR1450009.1 Mfa1 fimbrilin C-terminal domain-containing protein [Prevotella sp.]